MSVRVSINGFGRIGRNILRAIIESGRDDIKVVGINDLGPVETNAHLLRYDTVHGRFPADVKVIGDKIDAADMRKRLISIFAVLEFKAGNKDNAERLVKKAKAQGLNKELVRSWFNDIAVVENLISDLSTISTLD